MAKKNSNGSDQPFGDPVLLEILGQVGGVHGHEVAKTIAKGELTDEEIAKKTGLRINLVRRILYDLYENRVVNYRRVRDENTGWYVYYWQLQPDRAIDYVNTNRRQLLKKLEEQLEREKNTMFFSCSNGCVKLSFEEATETDFKCSKCGESLEQYDNSNVVTSLENRVRALRAQLQES
ncbi:MAG: transcription factor E [Candidatus Hadarchaeales archaeon]